MGLISWRGGDGRPLPFAAYAALVVVAFTLRSHADVDLFIVGGAALLLLFVGIHNAWDSVTYIVLDRAGTTDPGE